MDIVGHRKFLAIILMLCLFAITPNTFANKVKKLKLSAPQGFENTAVIKIRSMDGENWTVIDKTHLSKVTANLNAECKFAKRGNSNYKGVFAVQGFAAVGKTKPGSIYIPHASAASGDFQYADNGEEEVNFVRICNDELQNKVANVPGQILPPNLRKYKYLSEGFKVNYPNALNASYHLTCKPRIKLGFTAFRTEKTKLNAVIDCQASPLAKEKLPVKPIPVQKMNLVGMVRDVSFVANAKKISGTCKAGVDFDGTITSNRAGIVKYQYVSKDGDKSPVFSLNFTKAGTRETGNWNDLVAKPDTTQSFAQTALSKAPDISGWWRLDILSPATTKSATAKYNVYCNALVIPAKPVAKPKRGN